MTFATTGFWFLPWIALEVGLLVVLSLPSLRSWVMENATPARGLLAVACVAGAPFLFHPPGLAWLDAPVSSGYEIDAIGVSGAEYHVPASAFAPLSHHIAFDRLQFGPTVAANWRYGAVTTTAHLEALEQITDVDELKAFEATLGPPTGIAPSRQFLMTFLEYTGRHHSTNWFGLSALSTSGPADQSPTIASRSPCANWRCSGCTPSTTTASRSASANSWSH